MSEYVHYKYKSFPNVEALLYNFDTDSATPKQEHLDWLRNQIVPMFSHNHYHIYLKGKASKSGTKKHNMDLSRQRAENIAYYLQACGVRKQYIRADWSGEEMSAALAWNDSKERAVMFHMEKVTPAEAEKPAPDPIPPSWRVDPQRHKAKPLHMNALVATPARHDYIMAGKFMKTVGDVVVCAGTARRIISVWTYGAGGIGKVWFYVIERSTEEDPQALEAGRFYEQTVEGFLLDVNHWTPGAHWRTKGGQAMMQAEANIIMGAAVGYASLAGGIAALTASTFHFLVTNNKEIFGIKDALVAYFKLFDTLGMYAPTTCRMLKAALKLSASKIPEAMWKDPEGVAKLTGELIVLLGEQALKGKILSVSTFFKAIEKLFLSALEKLSPALRLQNAEFLKQKTSFAEQIRQIDPSLSPAEVDTIFKEISDNWEKIKPVLTTLMFAAEKVSG